jgi:hypothetical protein
MRHGMKVQIVIPYLVSHLQRYGVTVRGNVTSVYLPLDLHGMHKVLLLAARVYMCSVKTEQFQSAVRFVSGNNRCG